MNRFLERVIIFLCLLGLSGQTETFGAPLPKGVSQWTVAQDGTGQYESIQEAIDQAESGDTIWIKAGRYAEDLTIHSKEGVRVIGEGIDRVILTGLKRVGTLHIGKWPYGATNVEVSGMTVLQHGGLGIGIFNGKGVVLKKIRLKGMVFGQQVQGVRIEDCIIGGSETTGVAFADSEALLVGNFLHDNDHGVAVGGTSDVRLEQNVITRSLFEAVLVTDEARAILVQNTLVKNGGGVGFRDRTRGDVQGNIIGESRVGLLFSPASQIPLSFNALYHNDANYLLASSPNTPAPERRGKTDVNLAPRFVDPEQDDFRLQADTPLVGIGQFPFLGALAPVNGSP